MTLDAKQQTAEVLKCVGISDVDMSYIDDDFLKMVATAKPGTKDPTRKSQPSSRSFHYSDRQT